MIYLIDHRDSFTFNLEHLLSNYDDVFVSNYFEIDDIKIAHSNLIVFSSGPGTPENYPQTSYVYKKFKGKKKILGICLGFQQILYNEKGRIIRQNKIYHGHQSKIKVLKSSVLFKPNQSFKVGRYHSLKLKEPYYSKETLITMRCMETRVAMAIENKKDKIYGFQFHPESFLTENGKYIIQKILSA
ncbi:MAG: aminodeoxychorismate/anthranilate synthase component II [Pelagibacteraceae bacterium]|nr:aminodeoxychorismate/anthranilate synthase component II [Pelagibacteraceae bacterium]